MLKNNTNLDLSNFNSPQEFYTYIDNKNNYKNLHLKSINDISDLFFDFYKTNFSILKQKDKKVIFYEIKTFEYILIDGKLTSLSSKVIQNKDNNYINYLNERIIRCKNPILLSRYFHILFSVEKDNSDIYLHNLITNYLEILNDRKNIKYFLKENIEILKIIYILDFKVNSEKLLSITFEFISNPDLDNTTFLEFISSFININKNQFTKKQLNDFVEFCRTYFDSYLENSFNKKEYQLVAKIAKQLDKALKRSYFKKISLDDSTEDINFKETPEYNHYLELFNTIANHKYEKEEQQILPDLNEIERLFEEKYKNENQGIFNQEIIVYDKNGKTSEHFNGFEEIRYWFFLSTYKKLYEENGYFEYIEKLFIENYEKGIFNFEKFVLFFKKRTESRSPELYQILEPSLKLFFDYLSTISNKKNEDENNLRFKRDPHFLLVPALDSLSLKIELILRALNISLGRDNISKFIRDKKGQNVERVKNMEDFLLDKNEPCNAILKEEDIFLFRFLLIEKAGYNLRHDVAHSLITIKENYHRKLLFLVVISVIKMISYFDIES